MNWIRNIFSVVIGVLMLSCIYDKEGDCDNQLKVYFAATFDGRAVGALLPQDLRHIDLFVFDDNGLYVGTWSDDYIVFSPDYYMALPLGAGTYTFVAWCNARSCYYYKTNFVKGRTTLSEATIALINQNGVVDTRAELLMFGNYLQARVTRTRNQSFVVPLQRVTYDINVTTEGLPASMDDFRLTISDIVSEGKFDSKVSPSSGHIQYTTICGRTPQGQLSGSLTVIKLEEDRNVPVMTLKNESTGVRLFQGDLVRIILALRQLTPPVEVDFDRIYTYDIVLRFDADMNVTINVNGWNIPLYGDIDLE